MIAEPNTTEWFEHTWVPKNPTGTRGLMYILHSQRSTPWSSIKHGASLPSHVCCGNVVRTLNLDEPGSRLHSKKLQTMKQGCKKNWNSCARHLGEHSLLVKHLSSGTAFAFNCAVSLLLPPHQFGTWHFLIKKGSVSKGCGKYLGKTVGFECLNLLF